MAQVAPSSSIRDVPSNTLTENSNSLEEIIIQKKQELDEETDEEIDESIDVFILDTREVYEKNILGNLKYTSLINRAKSILNINFMNSLDVESSNKKVEGENVKKIVGDETYSLKKIGPDKTNNQDVVRIESVDVIKSHSELIQSQTKNVSSELQMTRAQPQYSQHVFQTTEPVKAENSLVYNFKEWGKDSNVNISLQSNQVIFKPSDSLVQQRLSDQWGSGEQPEHWLMARDEEQESDRKNRQHNEHEGEED